MPPAAGVLFRLNDSCFAFSPGAFGAICLRIYLLSEGGQFFVCFLLLIVGLLQQRRLVRLAYNFSDRAMTKEVPGSPGPSYPLRRPPLTLVLAFDFIFLLIAPDIWLPLRLTASRIVLAAPLAGLLT